jgi:hypothetical protein
MMLQAEQILHERYQLKQQLGNNTDSYPLAENPDLSA